MTAPRHWTKQDLDTIFNRAAEQIESIAREIPHMLHDVFVAVDHASNKPVINFVFTGAAEDAAAERLPSRIGDHNVTRTIKPLHK